MTITTKNTYEAAWYLLCGAQVIQVTLHRVAENKWEKKGYRREATITMDHVSESAREKWKSGDAHVRVWEFESARQRLKRLMRRYEDRNS